VGILISKHQRRLMSVRDGLLTLMR